ncbi:LmeA family phospholipid-binding protein [Streptomyces sp. NPDC090798]|uniref:LmeA family phospholipid-binding protein n=1 Tax=Streptomyces sp. NPDC090798 TaxID=3365968 RepID=UPI0037FF95D6
MRIRRTPLIITICLTATVAAAALADAAVGHTAQQRVVRAITCRLHPTGPVTAELTDTLAGLQVLDGNLGTVHITADGIHSADTDMNVDAVLHHVTTHGATDGGSATAIIAYTALQQHLGTTASGMTVGADRSGLTLTGTTGHFGLPITVHTGITTTADSLTITPTSVSSLGQAIPVSDLSSMPGATGLATSLKARTVRLPDLPAHARLTAAHPNGRGLVLQFSVPRTTSLSKSAGTPATTGARCSNTKA